MFFKETGSKYVLDPDLERIQNRFCTDLDPDPKHYPQESTFSMPYGGKGTLLEKRVVQKRVRNMILNAKRNFEWKLASVAELVLF